MRWRALSLLGAGMALIGGLAHAQTPPREIDDRPKKGDATAGARTIARDAASVGGGIKTGFAGSGVIVEASQDKTEASIQLSRSQSQMEDKIARFQAWTIKATAELDEDTGLADFITDEGLSSTWSLALAYNHVSAPRSPDPGLTGDQMAEVLEAAEAACKASGEAKCGTLASELVPWISRSDAEKIFNLHKAHWTQAWTLGATVGRKGFKWRDPLTLTEIPEKRTPYGVSGQWGAKRIGGQDWRTGWYGGVGAEYKQEYKDGKKGIKCLPSTGGAPLDCYQSPFAKPIREPSATVYALARKADVITALDVPIGLQLKPAYDFESKVTGFEATLYALTDKDGALTGGVRFKVQTRDDDPDTEDETFRVGLFVGKGF